MTYLMEAKDQNALCHVWRPTQKPSFLTNTQVKPLTSTSRSRHRFVNKIMNIRVNHLQVKITTTDMLWPTLSTFLSKVDFLINYLWKYSCKSLYFLRNQLILVFLPRWEAHWVSGLALVCCKWSSWLSPVHRPWSQDAREEGTLNCMFDNSVFSFCDLLCKCTTGSWDVVLPGFHIAFELAEWAK